MREYKLSKELIDQWQYYGFCIKYVNNETDDIVIENDSCSLYFDRLSVNNLFTLTTNLSMREEIVKLAYKTLVYLNDIKRENNDEQVNVTKVTWYDGDEEIEEEIGDDI
jgi:hypothetical protein